MQVDRNTRAAIVRLLARHEVPRQLCGVINRVLMLLRVAE